MRYYRVGGLIWQITGPEFRETEELAQFRCEACPADEQFIIQTVEKITPPSAPCVHRNLYEVFFGDTTVRARVIYQEQGDSILLKVEETGNGTHQVAFNGASLSCYGSNLLLRILDIPRRIIAHGGIFLHASYIVVNGEAILFTAPKQTGKSTQAELWRKTRGAEVINGDRAILRKINGVWCACSSPYCGTSKICRNGIMPINAIVILGQSSENTVRMATARESLAALLDGCTYNVWDKVQVNDAMTIMEQIVTELPMIKMDCLPDESAVGALEEFLWQQTKA